MRYLIALEPVDGGFGIQVPDLAISAYAPTVEEARRVASRAIAENLACYRQDGQEPPPPQSAEVHLRDPDFADLLFAYINVDTPDERLAA